MQDVFKFCSYRFIHYKNRDTGVYNQPVNDKYVTLVANMYFANKYTFIFELENLMFRNLDAMLKEGFCILFLNNIVNYFLIQS